MKWNRKNNVVLYFLHLNKKINTILLIIRLVTIDNKIIPIFIDTKLCIIVAGFVISIVNVL